MEHEINDIKIKTEIIDSVEALLEENIVKLEEDIPEYVNVNTFSNVKIESETENVKEIFQCAHCPNKYKKIAYLTIHEALHDPRRFCPICYEAFTCKKKLGHHLNQHIKDQMKEDKKLAFSCHYCEKSFDTKKKFILHERVHTNERPHKCEICGEGFKQSGTLKDHYVTHTKEKRFVCEICNGSFTTSSSLKRHKRKMHDKGKTINCKHCEAKFLNMADFRTHRNTAHPDVGYKRTCPVCFETFRTRCTYKKHKQHHDDHDQKKGKEISTKYYLCVLCGEKRSTFNLYLEHRRMHLNYTEEELEAARKNNVYKCKSCSQQFLSKSTLYKHMDIHMEKNSECNLCQHFYTYYGLKIHMRNSHHMLECRVCRKSVLGRTKLYYHYQKCHPTVKKPLACNICGKQYVARNHLNLHFKQVHEANSVKNFKCNICSKRFMSKFIMASHKHNRKVTIKNEGTDEPQKFCGEKPSNGAQHKRFQCKLCKKIFKSRKNCQVHLAFKPCILEKRTRKEATNNRCLVCSKTFATKDNLRVHMKLHSRAFSCRFCHKKYKMRAMRRHIQLHHPGEKIFKCDSCDEEFDLIYAYSKHVNEHKIALESPVQINSYADNVVDVKNVFTVNECDVIKHELEDHPEGDFKCE